LTSRAAALLCLCLQGLAGPLAGQAGPDKDLAADVVRETKRTWDAYAAHAWGHDELKPLSRGYRDWYGEPLGISPVDAYDTLKIMGLESDARRIEAYVDHELSFDKDVSVKTFELNIRVLGGLLSMYDLTGDPAVLAKAVDFANRLLPAFGSKSGLPYYPVNLRTGATSGRTVCAAEAASYLFEFGILSYYTQDPRYYRIAKACTRRIFESRSAIGLIGRNYDVETGACLDHESRAGCFVDSYYEYIYKGWRLFHDPELKAMWDASLPAINRYLAIEHSGELWYGICDSQTGRTTATTVTLWDPYLAGLLAYAGDRDHAQRSFAAWDRLWRRNGLLPMEYDVAADRVTNPRYYLNPELIEACYYMICLTRDARYPADLRDYYADVKRYCRTDIAYAHVEDVVTKRQSDEMSTFFLAETLKYFYLGFRKDPAFDLDHVVFSTEAHPFALSHFTSERLKTGLGL
jgi:hypothetical protein